MSITDELREYTERQIKWLDMTKVHYRELYAIADRIDAEHESACGEAYGNGVQSVALPDMTAYVKLPLDADGVPIRVGDMLEITHGFGTKDCGEVTDIHLQSGRCVVSIGFGDEEGVTAYPEDFRHHHEPTVEDVLREMLDVWGELPSNATNEAIIAEYATKLRLAGDAE